MNKKKYVMNRLANFFVGTFVIFMFVATVVRADDPLGIDGEYNYPPINGVNLGTTVLVKGTTGGQYEVYPKQNFVIPVVNCGVFPSDLLVRLNPLGGGQFNADLYFYNFVFIGGDPGRGNCNYVSKGTKRVTLVIQSDGILLKYIETGVADQFFAKVGANPPPVGDLAAPVAYTGSARITSGVRGKLKYGCNDNSGQAAAVIKVLKNGRLVKTLTQQLGSAVSLLANNFVNFTGPRAVSSRTVKYSYSVQCVDPSGNTSGPIAGKLTVVAQRR